jgi:hypothetical protein
MLKCDYFTYLQFMCARVYIFWFYICAVVQYVGTYLILIPYITLKPRSLFGSVLCVVNNLDILSITVLEHNLENYCKDHIF